MQAKKGSNLFMFFRKTVALFVSFSFILSESVSYAAPSLRASEGGAAISEPKIAPVATLPRSDELSAVSIPKELGRIEESFVGNSGKTIVYIQDAHDSLEAQENIAKLIHYFVEHYRVRTIFEEGYEGPVPTDEYFGFIQDPQIKKEVSYFLMDKLRIGGAEYAHINRCKSAKNHGGPAEPCGGDFNLIGADNIKLHLENIDWYRKNAQHKEETEKDILALSKEIDKLANQHFPKELKEWMKLKRRLDEKQLSLLDYLKRTLAFRHPEAAKRPKDLEILRRPEGLLRMTRVTPNRNAAAYYPTISRLLSAENTQDKEILEKVKAVEAKALFQEIDRLENDFANSFLSNERDNQIFHYHKVLTLLKRLNEIELTPSEYEAVKDTLQGFNTQSFAQFIVQQTRKSIVLSRKWEENIQKAIKFYETSQARDEAIVKTLRQHEAEGGGWKAEGNKNPNDSLQPSSLGLPPAVLVFGGFHKERIKEILQKEGYSFLVVSPKITSIDPRHQGYYKRLMSIGHHPFEIPLYVRQAARAETRFLQVREGGAASDAFRRELSAVSGVIQRSPALNRSSLLLQIEKELPEIVRSEVRAHEFEYEGLPVTEILDAFKKVDLKSLRSIANEIEENYQELGPWPRFNPEETSIGMKYLYLIKEGELGFDQWNLLRSNASLDPRVEAPFAIPVIQKEFQKRVLSLSATDPILEEVVRQYVQDLEFYLRNRQNDWRESPVVRALEGMRHAIASAVSKYTEGEEIPPEDRIKFLAKIWDLTVEAIKNILIRENRQSLDILNKWQESYEEQMPHGNFYQYLKGKKTWGEALQAQQRWSRIVDEGSEAIVETAEKWFSDEEGIVAENIVEQFDTWFDRIWTDRLAFRESCYELINDYWKPENPQPPFFVVWKEQIDVVNLLLIMILFGQLSIEQIFLKIVQLKEKGLEEGIYSWIVIDTLETLLGREEEFIHVEILNWIEKRPEFHRFLYLIVVKLVLKEIYRKKNIDYLEELEGQKSGSLWMGRIQSLAQFHAQSVDVLQKLDEKNRFARFYPILFKSSSRAEMRTGEVRAWRKAEGAEAEGKTVLFFDETEFWSGSTPRGIYQTEEQYLERIKALRKKAKETAENVSGATIEEETVRRTAIFSHEDSGYIDFFTIIVTVDKNQKSGKLGDPRAEVRSEAVNGPRMTIPIKNWFVGDSSVQSKGTFLMNAGDFINLSLEQCAELFKVLSTNRSEVRLVVYNHPGQIPMDPVSNAILGLGNVTQTDVEADTVLQRYGIPNSVSIHLSKAGRNPKEDFRGSLLNRVKFFRLKEEIGVIAAARLYAINGGHLPGVVEKDGFVDPPSELLASIQQQYLSHWVAAFSA